MDQHKILITELIKLLEGGTAHASFDDAVEGLAPEMRGVVPDQLAYSIWQLVEHIRIAQWDMLEFSKKEAHTSPPWPDGYWVAETEPENEEDWESSIQRITDDRDEFIALLKNGDIYNTIPHGNGQSILREALQIADHNAYHTAQIILIRRLLGDWE